MLQWSRGGGDGRAGPVAQWRSHEYGPVCSAGPANLICCGIVSWCWPSSNKRVTHSGSRNDNNNINNNNTNANKDNRNGKLALKVRHRLLPGCSNLVACKISARRQPPVAYPANRGRSSSGSRCKTGRRAPRDGARAARPARAGSRAGMRRRPAGMPARIGSDRIGTGEPGGHTKRVDWPRVGAPSLANIMGSLSSARVSLHNHD
jgi:hypothetical protein